MRLPKLTSDDVLALLAFDRWLADSTTETRLAEVASREAALPPAAAAWYANAPGYAVRAELARWRPRYRAEKTRAGWRVFRLLTTRGVYRKKPSRTGLTKEQAGEYTNELVRIS